MKIIEYNRQATLLYARTWAFMRNPAYYDFSMLGGDCTAFASQCLYAGSNVMNYTPVFGWYYNSPNDRAAAWTGVEFFYRFLIDNATSEGVGLNTGPFAEEVQLNRLEIGDFIQLGRSNLDFYHTLVVVGFQNGIPLVAAHSYDVYNKLLTAYRFEQLRCLHILGVKTPF